MRFITLSLLVAPLVAAPLALAPVAAWAQSDPSSDQIIQSLKPSGNLVNGGIRGIRPAPAAGAASDATATPAAPAAGAPAPVKHKPGSKPVVAAAKPMGTTPITGTPTPGTPNDGAPSIDLTVAFATGSDTLTAQARRTLDQLGKALSSPELANYRFRIEGHTDTVGTPEMNKALSQRRADAVIAYLETTYSVPATRLEGIGLGEEGLAVPTPPQTPNAANRRVKVVNIGS